MLPSTREVRGQCLFERDTKLLNIQHFLSDGYLIERVEYVVEIQLISTQNVKNCTKIISKENFM